MRRVIFNQKGGVASFIPAIACNLGGGQRRLPATVDAGVCGNPGIPQAQLQSLPCWAMVAGCGSDDCRFFSHKTLSTSLFNKRERTSL